MPVYEYRCEQCTHQFEATQSIHARPEDTACPHCKGIGATRVLSAFASQVKGTHKTGFKEMQAYNMLHERMDRFSQTSPRHGQTGGCHFGYDVRGMSQERQPHLNRG